MKLRTLTEAAAMLGVSRARLRRGVQAGRYPCMRWGSRTLVDVDALRAIIAEEDAQNADGTISLRECAEAIGLGPDTLRRMTKTGMIPCVHVGRACRYRLEDVQRAISGEMNRIYDDED